MTIRSAAREALRLFGALRYTWHIFPLQFPAEFEKRAIILGFLEQSGIRSFVETGTYLGNTIASIVPHVDAVTSIEIDANHASKAQERFADDDRVTIVHGDSAAILPDILFRINTPTLFWLDGHFSGSVASGNPKKSPIMTELNCILNHHVKEHIILVDDARCFIGRRGYPTIRQVVAKVKGAAPMYQCSVHADIIRIYRSEFRVVRSS